MVDCTFLFEDVQMFFDELALHELKLFRNGYVLESSNNHVEISVVSGIFWSSVYGLL